MPTLDPIRMSLAQVEALTASFADFQEAVNAAIESVVAVLPHLMRLRVPGLMGITDADIRDVYWDDGWWVGTWNHRRVRIPL